MNKPEPAPQIDIFKDGQLLEKLAKDLSNPEVANYIDQANEEYLYWDRFKNRYKSDNLTAEQGWAYVSFTRKSKSKRIPLQDINHKQFGYWIPNSFLKQLHFLDQNASGSILIDDPQVHAGEKERFIINSIMEEAIASSQLEGAATTRIIAKAMLRSGRKPKNHSEQMIVNNYLTMKAIKNIINEPLSPKMILDIHSIIAKDTLDDPSCVGRFREHGKDEEIKVYWDDGTILHTPPPASELEERIKLLCDFANSEDKTFTHPVVKAIILHFWLAYDHPFMDGNGRTARALFYWYMLKKGYWLVEYLSISRIIKKAPAQYARAYLYSETDGEDLTYFLSYHLKIIELAVSELKAYLRRKVQEAKEAEKYLLANASLSYRQSQFLRYVIKHPSEFFTIEQFRNTYGTTYETARSDLQSLEVAGYLKRTKRGKTFYYIPVDNLYDRVMRKTRKKN